MAERGAQINAALHHLGQSESQTPLEDDNTWVARVRSRYDDRTRALFERHAWNFCTKLQLLTASAPTPDGFAYGFDKPAGCWCIVKVTGSSDIRDPGIAFDDRGGRICSDITETWLWFVSSYWKDREGSWPQVFADAHALELASAVAPVTEDENTIERVDRKALKALKGAKNWDALQKRQWEIPPGRLIQSRWGGSSRSRAENG